MRRRPEEETLRARVEGFAIAQYINRNLPNSSKLYDIGSVPLAYTDRNVDGYFQSAVGERIYYVFFSGVDAFPQWAPTLRTTFNFHAERLNRLRIERAPTTGPIWAVSEIRFFDNGREVVPNGGWRLHSSDFQWDIGFAFDNNLATSWHAWDRPRRGMFIEVEFGKPVELTDVQLYAPLDQRSTLLAAKGENWEGRTETLSTAARFENVPLPANYWLQIGRAIKTQGYTHLILRQDIPGAEALRGDPAAWGTHFLVEIDGLTLYQFD